MVYMKSIFYSDRLELEQAGVKLCGLIWNSTGGIAYYLLYVYNHPTV